MLTQEQLDHFKQRLLDEKKKIIEKVEQLNNFLFRIRGREAHLIKKIDESLAKIENRTYGICDECGEEISLGRLEARPVAPLCITCKEEQEKLEKRQGR